MSDLVANIFGSAAAVCSVTSFAPQAIKIWKERDASAVSLKTYSLTVSCFILWTIYGVMTSAWPVTIANASALVMASAVPVGLMPRPPTRIATRPLTLPAGGGPSGRA